MKEELMKYKNQIRRITAYLLTVLLLLGTCCTGSALGAAATTTLVFDAVANEGHVGTPAGPKTYRYTDISLEDVEYAIHSTEAYRNGYKWLGWYSSTAGGNKAETMDYLDKVFAHWIQDKPISASYAKAERTYTLAGTSLHAWKVVSKPEFISSVTAIAPGTGAVKLVCQFDYNGSDMARTGTIELRDKYGNLVNISVTQEGYPSLNAFFGNAYDTTFKNLCSVGEPATYNFRYFSLFNGCNTTTCTDCTVGDLLQRALVYDRRLSENCFFDIRDVLRGNSFDGDLARNLQVIEKNGYSLVDSQGKRVSLGGERVDNYDAFPRVTFCTNSFGFYAGMPHYTYTFFQKSYRRGTVKKELLQKLLEEHPEGLYIRVLRPLYVNGAENPHSRQGHSFLVTRYEKGTFYYVDCGGYSAGECTFEYTCVHKAAKFGYGNEGEMFANIVGIGYIER